MSIYFMASMPWPAVRKSILAELNRRKKAASSNSDFDGAGFLKILLGLWVKAARYQSIDLERLYSFENS